MLEFYKGKRVFITGHTGFKGSWLCKILLLAGAKVRGYALEPNTNPSMFKILKLEKDIDNIIGDIRDYNSLFSAIQDFKPDIVFHLAAQPLVRKAYANPRYTFEVNVLGTINLMEAIRNCPSVKSIVNVTTDKVYLNDERTNPYVEEDIICGDDPYSSSKSCSELVTFSYNKSYFDAEPNISVATARSGNMIGGGDFSEDRIIPDCVKATLKGETIKVRNPESVRPYQFVLDGLNGYLILAQAQYANKIISGNYNFGPNDKLCITTEKLVTLFTENWPKAKWITEKENGPHEANYLKLDATKANTILGWSPKYNSTKMMQKTVNWYKCFSENKDMNAITEKQIKEYFSDEKK